MTSDIESRLHYRVLCFQPGSDDRAFFDEIADEIARLKAQLTRAKEALKQTVKDMTCRNNASHYCPNCDNTTFDARVHVEHVLAELEK